MLTYVKTASDLMTSREETRKGFLKQALTKTGRADTFVKEAQLLSAALSSVAAVDDLAKITVKSFRAALVAAAGFSDKARAKFTEPELEAALGEVLTRIAASSPNDWREEIVYRFLLTRGDTLGGMMRNVTGAEGGALLAGAIASALEASGIDCDIANAPKNPNKITSITWGDRLLLFDKKPAFIANNIDAILLDTKVGVPAGGKLIETQQAFLAAGELKGGIDPAGADEHWKTAKTAFARIREKFPTQIAKGLPPYCFFVGGAIEAAMAGQIFDELSNGHLAHAANLTKKEQLDDLVSWLIAL